MCWPFFGVRYEARETQWREQVKVCVDLPSSHEEDGGGEYEGSHARWLATLMPCFHPMPAVRMSDGSVSFVSRNKRGVVDDFELPCRQCIGCRLERSRQWAMRCLHEASLHDANSFITLTYDDEHVPPGGSLRYRDFQLFMKRLRKRFDPLKISFLCWR